MWFKKLDFLSKLDIFLYIGVYLFYIIKNKIKYSGIIRKKDNFASAGSRTRISCLEGNYDNRYTTNAYLVQLNTTVKIFGILY